MNPHSTKILEKSNSLIYNIKNNTNNNLNDFVKYLILNDNHIRLRPVAIIILYIVEIIPN